MECYKFLIWTSAFFMQFHCNDKTGKFLTDQFKVQNDVGMSVLIDLHSLNFVIVSTLHSYVVCGQTIIATRVESAIMRWVVLWDTACNFNAISFKSINF